MSVNAVHPSQIATPHILTVDASTGDALVPISPTVAREFGKHPRTIKRWSKDPALQFPKLIMINGRLFVSRAALNDWKAAMLASATQAA